MDLNSRDGIFHILLEIEHLEWTRHKPVAALADVITLSEG